MKTKRTNQFAKIVFIAIFLYGAVGALSFLVNNFSISFVNDDFFIGVVDGHDTNGTFPVYKSAQPMSLTPKSNLSAGTPPMITRNDNGLENVSANNNGLNQNYAVNSKKMGSADASVATVMGSNMPNIAFQSSSRGASANKGMQGNNYSVANTSSNGWSKVPFATTAPGDAILIDPKGDPLEQNQIPIGNSEWVLVFFGMIYFLIKKRKLFL